MYRLCYCMTSHTHPWPWPDCCVCVFLWAVRHVRKDERKYYEELLKYSRDHLMLYPYHLSDIMVKGLRVTPFSYYIGIMEVSNFWRIAQQIWEDWGMKFGGGGVKLLIHRSIWVRSAALLPSETLDNNSHNFISAFQTIRLKGTELELLLCSSKDSLIGLKTCSNLNWTMSSILASLETAAEKAVSNKTGNPRTHYHKDLSLLQLPAVSVMCSLLPGLLKYSISYGTPE